MGWYQTSGAGTMRDVNWLCVYSGRHHLEFASLKRVYPFVGGRCWLSGRLNHYAIVFILATTWKLISIASNRIRILFVDLWFNML